MTPSEIAELEDRLIATRIKFNMGYREEPFVNPDGPDAIEAIRKQAATILELEFQRDNFAALYAAAAKGHGTASAKLKIATEALESAQFSLDALDNIPAEVCVMNAQLAFQVITQALDRIKETK